LSRPTRWQVETGHTSGPHYAELMRQATAGSGGHGEVDLVESLLAPPARVLDAGCGTGRTTIELARRGYAVTGVDLDPSMITEARREAPELDWLEADLATLALDRDAYDVALLAGNVLVFVAPDTHAQVLAAVTGHLRDGGLLIAGFRLEPDGYDLGSLDADAAAAGLQPVERWATWEREPYVGGDYAVSFFRRPP
jgi:SAM-dependent methyltransferase